MFAWVDSRVSLVVASTAPTEDNSPASVRLKTLLTKLHVASSCIPLRNPTHSSGRMNAPQEVSCEVSVKDVHRAVREINEQAHLVAVRDSAPQERLLLVAITNEVHLGGKVGSPRGNSGFT